MSKADPDFEVLFEREYQQLVRGLTFAAGSADDAADVVQDAFVQLHRHWGRVRRYDDPGAWVRRVAINRLSNHRRWRARRDTAIDRLGHLLSPPADLLVEERIDLYRAVASLPQKQRVVVGLHYVAGLQVTEIATLMSVSVGTVKSQLFDARKDLARLMEVVDGR